MDDLDAFRQEVRQWLDTHCPVSMRGPGPEEMVMGGSQATFATADQKLWFERMRDKGWFAPGWPAQYGGGGLDAHRVRVLEDEMRRMKCRVPQVNIGIWMLGPVLLEFGNEAQKARFLPPMTRGEQGWCQGFSEPNAGSDLASLKTAAREDGDHYVVSGAKIWTSGADQADWMYALVRTDPAAPKHLGISLLLIDMKSPGVTVRPIELISGASKFCQVFFDDVRVPKENLVGPVNVGWTVAKRLLQHEREAMSKMGDLNLPTQCELVPTVRRFLADRAAPGDQAIRLRAVNCAMDEHAYHLTVARMGQQAKARMDVAGLMSIVKLVHTEQDKRKSAVLIEAMGNRGLGWEGDEFTEDELTTVRQWLLSYTLTIAGGSSEVQLNIVAKRVLGLPGN
ncbi:MAG: acyl-CoA dehydrogenase family protein [Rhodocyclaceae bacterium]|nr:acyl-CoA dehydrogenase family protein [Rhodocyclaceae bacterium]MBK9311499.1 acyl-CoA dehydrogenase family protein [Rhodocyclaceae bacterium]